MGGGGDPAACGCRTLAARIGATPQRYRADGPVVPVTGAPGAHLDCRDACPVADHRAARLQRGGADRPRPRRAVRLSPAPRRRRARGRPASAELPARSRSSSSTTAAPTGPPTLVRGPRRSTAGRTTLRAPDVRTAARARRCGRHARRRRRPHRLRRRRHGDAARRAAAARRGARGRRRRARLPDPARRLGHARDRSPASGACSARRSTRSRRSGSSARSRTRSAGSRASGGTSRATCSRGSGSPASCSTSSSSTSPGGAATADRDRARSAGRTAAARGCSPACGLAMRVAWDLFRIPLLHRDVSGRAARDRARPIGRLSAAAGDRPGGAARLLPSLAIVLVRRRRRRRRWPSPATRSATTSSPTTRRRPGPRRAAAYDTSFEAAGGFGLFYYPPTFIPLVLPFGAAAGDDRASGRGSRCCSARSRSASRSCRCRATVRWLDRAPRRPVVAVPVRDQARPGRPDPVPAVRDRLALARSTRRGSGVERGARGGDQAPARAHARLGAPHPALARPSRPARSSLVVLAVARDARRRARGMVGLPDRSSGRVSDPITTPHNVTPGAIAYRLGRLARARRRASSGLDGRRSSAVVVAALRLRRPRALVPGRGDREPAAVADPVGPLRDAAAAPVAWLRRSRALVGDRRPLATSVVLVGAIPPWVYPVAFWATLLGVVVVGLRRRDRAITAGLRGPIRAADRVNATSAASAATGRLFTKPMTIGSHTLPPLGLVALATIGASLLVVVAVTRWAVPSDELAYWLGAERLAAGEPLYDLALPIGSPYAYWYPPPLAQVLAPFALFVPDMWFVGRVDGDAMGCLFFLGNRRILVALALIAYLPVAVELWYRNVHLLIAVLAVLAIRKSSLFWHPRRRSRSRPRSGPVPARPRARSGVRRGRARRAGDPGRERLARRLRRGTSSWISCCSRAAVPGRASCPSRSRSGSSPRSCWWSSPGGSAVAGAEMPADRRRSSSAIRPYG